MGGCTHTHNNTQQQQEEEMAFFYAAFDLDHRIRDNVPFVRNIWLSIETTKFYSELRNLMHQDQPQEIEKFLSRSVVDGITKIDRAMFGTSTLLSKALDHGAYAWAQCLVEKHPAWSYPSRGQTKEFDIRRCPLYRAALNCTPPRIRDDNLIRRILRADGNGTYWDALKEMTQEEACVKNFHITPHTTIRCANKNFEDMQTRIGMQTAICALYSGVPWVLEEVADIFALDLWGNGNSLFMSLVQDAICNHGHFPDEQKPSMYESLQHFANARGMDLYNTVQPPLTEKSVGIFDTALREKEDMWFGGLVKATCTLPVIALNYMDIAHDIDKEDIRTLTVRLEDQVFRALDDAGLPVTRDIVTLIVRAL